MTLGHIILLANGMWRTAKFAVFNGFFFFFFFSPTKKFFQVRFFRLFDYSDHFPGPSESEELVADCISHVTVGPEI